MIRASGIYAFIHRDTGMVYVGSSVDIRGRIYNHIGEARHGSRTRFHRALREFGVQSFDVEVLEECPRDALLDRERFYIALLDAASPANLNTFTEPTALPYGVRKTAVTRARISATKKGVPLSPEHKARVKSALIGRVCSAETRAKIGASNKGKIRTPEYLRAISLARKGKPCGHIAVMIASNVGRVRSPETREKIAARHRGRKKGTPSAAHRAKISAALTGITRSPETRLKMSAARRATVLRKSTNKTHEQIKPN